MPFRLLPAALGLAGIVALAGSGARERPACTGGRVGQRARHQRAGRLHHRHGRRPHSRFATVHGHRRRLSGRAEADSRRRRGDRELRRQHHRRPALPGHRRRRLRRATGSGERSQGDGLGSGRTLEQSRRRIRLRRFPRNEPPPRRGRRGLRGCRREVTPPARAARFFSTPKGRVGPGSRPRPAYAAAIMAEPGAWRVPGRGGQSALRFNSDLRDAGGFVAGGQDDLRSLSRTARDGTDRPTTRRAKSRLLGERFRKAPAGVNEALLHLHAESNRSSRRRPPRSPRASTRSDFISVAIHAHQFADAAGGERGSIRPKRAISTPIPAWPISCRSSRRRRSTPAPMSCKAPASTCFRGSKSTKDGRSFMASASSSVKWTSWGFQDWEGAVAARRTARRSSTISMVAVSRFEKGQLAEVRLYPVQLTDDGVRMAHRGVPRLASPAAAQRILTRLQKLSQPFGTTIAIEGNYRRDSNGAAHQFRQLTADSSPHARNDQRRTRRIRRDPFWLCEFGEFRVPRRDVVVSALGGLRQSG